MAKATYIEERSASPSRLTREDVVTLGQIVRTGFDDERSFFRISTELPTAKVEADSVEDFFQSNLLPDTLQQLSLYCSDRSVSSKDRLIHIYFFSTSTSVKVVGEDHEWAVGRCEAIARFLKERRPWYCPFIRYFELWPLQLLVVLIFFIAILFPSYISGSIASQVLYYVFLGVYWIVYGCYSGPKHVDR